METKKYKRIFYNLYPQLCLYAYRFLDNLELSREITQSVFKETIENEVQFENENQTKNYFYKEVKSKCIGHLEKLGYSISQQGEVNDIDDYTTDDFTEFNTEVDTTTAIRNIMRTLSKEVGDIISLSIGDYKKE